MAHRKALEAELNRFDLLGTRLENNLKNVTQALTNDRNHHKGLYEGVARELNDLKTQNVELKAINGCLGRQQKLYEKHAFKNHDQSIVNRIMEAANLYAGDRHELSDPALQTTPQQQRDQPLSSFTNAPTAAAAEDVVNLDDDDTVIQQWNVRPDDHLTVRVSFVNNFIKIIIIFLSPNERTNNSIWNFSDI